MAASSSKRAAAALLAACALAAGAQEREQAPIQVESRGGTDFDYSKGVFRFDGITITQGDIRIVADAAVAHLNRGVDLVAVARDADALAA